MQDSLLNPRGREKRPRSELPPAANYYPLLLP
ncbi:hypothetical protein CCACVL1_12159 [Corchorus capsularis]|uniref:Uncharacterized protein n=1 Tax=Corchorus capsularis TaxID=210143 RepID=A0A1R3IGZ2_COCAP|nr:hypothetical protein CCACVL1_12159 [Corchorus capsularis]